MTGKAELIEESVGGVKDRRKARIRSEYRVPGFLAVVWFGYSHTPYPPLPSVSWTGDTQGDWDREITCGRERGGREWAKSRIKRPQKSIRILWPGYSSICFISRWLKSFVCTYCPLFSSQDYICIVYIYMLMYLQIYPVFMYINTCMWPCLEHLRLIKTVELYLAGGVFTNISALWYVFFVQ